jgi:peptidoglycan hydrolase-like protein with peptidoglycan-binding domain
MEPDRVTLDSLKTLRKGDSGLTVKWLQELLLAAGHELGKADGVFGSKTMAAVEDFQRANGLTVDGIAGKKTIAALTALDGETVEEPEDDEPEDEMTIEEKVGVLWEWMQNVRGGDANG